jgi:RNA polymerase sigma-70 factor (ECF subfamily)
VDGLREDETAGSAADRRDAAPDCGPSRQASATVAQADSEAARARLFGAAYLMLGSAREAEETVREARARIAAGDPGGGGGGYGGGYGGGEGGGDAAYTRLVHEVVGGALRRAEAAYRGRREGHAGHAAHWLPEPVLTGDGVLGRLDTAQARESVAMARLVVLERLPPAERAAYVLREQFGYGPAEAAQVLGLADERCRSLLRRARQRVRESESTSRTEAGGEQRLLAVEELLRALLAEDRAAVEVLLADDVVAWSDGGWEPGAVRRPILGAVKVGRFLAGLLARAPEGIRATVAEVNGDAAVVGTVARDEVAGVLVPEFGERGIVGIRTVADRARLAYFTRQWAVRSSA